MRSFRIGLRPTSLRPTHGNDAWTSHAPAKSQDDMMAVARTRTSVVVATASACATSPLASPERADRSGTGP